MIKFIQFFTILLALFSSSAFAITNGKSPAFQFYQLCSTTNITTAAYTQVIAAASNTSGISQLECLNSTTQVLKLSVGASGSEVMQAYIFPGSVYQALPLGLNKATRIAVEAVGTSATTGVLVCNFWK